MAFVLILAAQAAVIFLPERMGLRYRFTIALAAFPLIGAVVAAMYGWVSHYWN